MLSWEAGVKRIGTVGGWRQTHKNRRYVLCMEEGVGFVDVIKLCGKR